MYVDLTPGTPDIYREEALRKLLTVGYEMLPERMIYGTDGSDTRYGKPIADMVAFDNAIYDKIGVGVEQRNRIFSENLLSFVNG